MIDFVVDFDRSEGGGASKMWEGGAEIYLCRMYTVVQTSCVSVINVGG